MLLSLRYQQTAFGQNCRILFNGDTQNCFICDPGADAVELYNEVQNKHFTAQAILLTHGHHDHCAVARELADLLKVKIYGPTKEDEFWLKHLPEQSNMFGLPHAEPLQVDYYLQDQQELDLNVGESIKVMHCPGHTPGHVCYYMPTSGLLLSGDVLFAGSVGRSDFPLGDPQHLKDSIFKKIMTLPPKTKVLPGHGPDTTIERERTSNPFLIPDIY